MICLKNLKLPLCGHSTKLIADTVTVIVVENHRMLVPDFAGDFVQIARALTRERFVKVSRKIGN